MTDCADSAAAVRPECGTCCTRRGFLAAAASCAAFAACGGLPQPSAPAHDESLTLVLAGIGEYSAEGGLRHNVERCIAPVLSMGRLPARCLVAGGASREADKALDALRRAGVRVFAAGNDAVETAHCRFVPAGNGFSVAAKSGAKACILDGRTHKWLAGGVMRNGEMVRTVSLPSAGTWGDFGYVLFRTDSRGATATLEQRGILAHAALPPERNPAEVACAAVANTGAESSFRWPA